MMRCGTAIFAMRSDGSFLLCRPTASSLWSVPGGGIEDGETWRDAASRALAEETMLSVPEPNLLAITTADGCLTIWCAGPLRGIVRPDTRARAEMEWVTCGVLWKFDLRKTHWTPLLDEVGGTVELDRKLKGRNS